nr:fimbrillin family protein [Prevotella sp.]
MKHQLISLAVAALCFTACTNDDHISQDSLADTPIRLNVSVTNPTTRAGYSNELKPDAFWLMVYHDDHSNDKYNYDIFAEKVGDTWKTYDLHAYVENHIKNEVTMLCND